MSTTFGRAADFDDADALEARDVLQPSVKFDRSKTGPPRKEPWFGTYFWIEDLARPMVQQWEELAAPQMPPKDSMLSLPPKNPFVPIQFDIKPTPPDDTDHPLLNCSLKLCVVLGKQKVRCFKIVRRFDLLMELDS